MFTTYHNFEIVFEPQQNGSVPFSVKSPGGDARGVLRVPTANTSYQALMQQITQLTAREDVLMQLGKMLFDALFQDHVKDVYNRTQGTLKNKTNEGFRITFNLSAAESQVGAVPWEFLYDPDQEEHIVLLDTPIMRYIQQSSVTTTLQTKLPLKVLVTGAQTTPDISIANELEAVQKALSRLGENVQFTVESRLTVDKFQELLLENFHIWHFVGHGSFTPDQKMGQLHFEDDSGDVQYVSARELRIYLNRSSVRLVVLDACKSAQLATALFQSMAPALIKAQVPAVVAMQFKVPESSTVAFASQFYKTLSRGFPIDACVTEGRKAVMRVAGIGTPDWGIPVVYTRTLDGRLFDLPTNDAQQPSPPLRSGCDGGDVTQIGGTNISVKDSNLDHSPISVGGGSTPGQVAGARSTDQDEARERLDDRLRTKKRQLHELHMQEAMYGISTPPYVKMQIEDLDKEVTALERERQALGG